ncbi:DUF7266 family protein [Halomarina ordinaria]|uniref:Uncharacterized protein n=1 Tax=Halomarina ordinaria TaxID=3033939 RepID=A0ABD5U8T8_9EURY|nr:hypothetical protein [Halomarina sp. PSRA2]
MGDTRAVTPVVGKTLEAGVVVLFIGLLTATLYGGVVPDYRTTAAEGVGERTLVAGAERVQQAVPPAATHADVTLDVHLPRTIRGEPYAVVADGRALVLDHPHPAVDGRVRLALPERVARVEGEWRSTERAVVAVRGGERVVVELTTEEGRA